MKKILFVILSITFFTSCHDNDGNIRDVAFRDFMKKFKPIDIPLTINIHSDFNCNCEALDQSSTDSLFVKFRNSNTVAFGYMPDTTDFYAFVYFYTGDAPYFWVTTFDKSFNKIADTLILNKNGFMPATRCLDGSSHLAFQESFRFMTIDSLNYLDCDSLGELVGTVDSIVFKKVLTNTISIEKSGSISINEN